VNRDLDSSQTKNLDIHMVNTLLNQDNIYYMNAKDITSIRIQKEILSVILSCSLNETLMHLLSQIPLLSLL